MQQRHAVYKPTLLTKSILNPDPMAQSHHSLRGTLRKPYCPDPIGARQDMIIKVNKPCSHRGPAVRHTYVVGQFRLPFLTISCYEFTLEFNRLEPFDY